MLFMLAATTSRTLQRAVRILHNSPRPQIQISQRALAGNCRFSGMLPSKAEDLVKMWKQRRQEGDISPLPAATGYKCASSEEKLSAAESPSEMNISLGKFDTLGDLLMISSSDLIVSVRLMSRSRRGVKPHICRQQINCISALSTRPVYWSKKMAFNQEEEKYILWSN